VKHIENKHTKEDLKVMQAWPLERKMQVTQTRIMEWYLRHDGKVYVSFSGGKDSTVLLDIARRCYPDIEAVFIDTGLEYPEIREFVKTFEKVTWLSPMRYDKESRSWVKTNFKEVLGYYGYPVISKDVSQSIEEARRNPNGYMANKFNQNSDYVKRYGARYDLSKWRYLLESV
jgi:3'-phosphoadenosine 5'-phosphosulfate sulfotransferase (PAPS reductase)/FAD synthetase